MVFYRLCFGLLFLDINLRLLLLLGRHDPSHLVLLNPIFNARLNFLEILRSRALITELLLMGRPRVMIPIVEVLVLVQLPVRAVRRLASLVLGWLG